VLIDVQGLELDVIESIASHLKMTSEILVEFTPSFVSLPESDFQRILQLENDGWIYSIPSLGIDYGKIQLMR
jgi:hypothetical protein